MVLINERYSSPPKVWWCSFLGSAGKKNTQPQPSCDEAWLSGLRAGKDWKSVSHVGRGGISLPVSVSFPVSRLGLVPAVNLKEVTFTGEIKDHAIQGGESAGKPALVFISQGRYGGAKSCQDIAAVTDRTEYVNLTP